MGLSVIENLFKRKEAECRLKSGDAFAQEQPENSYVVVMRAWSGFYFGSEDPLPPCGSALSWDQLNILCARTDPAYWVSLTQDEVAWSPRLAEVLLLLGEQSRSSQTSQGGLPPSSAWRLTLQSGISQLISCSRTPRKKRAGILPPVASPEDPNVPSPGRRLDSALAHALIAGWMNIGPVKRLERWNRAAIQSPCASRVGAWLEIPATNHLWVGMEALTPIALEQFLKAESITRDQLLRDGGSR